MDLALFFTDGVSLRTWEDVGSFEREVALYRALQRLGTEITFVTYGDRRDLDYRKRLPGFRIVCNRFSLPAGFYRWRISRLGSFPNRPKQIVKTNQIPGAEVGMAVAARTGSKFVARCGYLFSDFQSRMYGDESQQALSARRLESEVFRNADRVVVTTPTMRESVVADYGLSFSKIHVIPNYVETEVFKPMPMEKKVPRQLGFVGRLEPQKNVFSMIEAVAKMDIELVLIGEGGLRLALETQARKLGANVRFLGNVRNHELPHFLNSCEAFILPSHYEGHPKALLEAMACGLPVIGSNVPGIRELIQDRHNGMLCTPTPAGIRKAIEELISDEELGKRLGQNARNFVMEKFSLEKIVELEWTMLNELVG